MRKGGLCQPCQPATATPDAGDSLLSLAAAGVTGRTGSIMPVNATSGPALIATRLRAQRRRSGRELLICPLRHASPRPAESSPCGHSTRLFQTRPVQRADTQSHSRRTPASGRDATPAPEVAQDPSGEVSGPPVGDVEHEVRRALDRLPPELQHRSAAARGPSSSHGLGRPRDTRSTSTSSGALR